ncbi:MAG: hypothetical protein WBG50_11995 [Desulfomonilaceae bacterium]
MPRVSDCRAIWAALELGGSRSLDDLEMTTGVKPEQSLEYLDLLIQHRYVRAAGVRRAGSGEAVPMFLLVRRTGPDAPYLDIWKKLVDPNERRAAEMARKTEDAPRKPSLAARMRVAAEHLQSFTRPDLIAAVFGPEPSCIQRQWFTSAWNQLTLRGHIMAAEDDWFYLVRDVDPVVDSIRKALREGIGGIVRYQAILDALGVSPTGPQMRHAVDLLKAEGLHVTRRGYGRKTIFSIEATNSTK